MAPDSGWSAPDSTPGTAPDPSGPPPAITVPETIVCVDCGGPARLLSRWDDENPPRPGDVAVYRCVDCLDRWDVVLPGRDEPDE